MAGITTATDVAEMYERLQDAQAELTTTRQLLAVVTQEKETLQARLIVATRERDDELVRVTQMRIIVEQVSHGLVSGLSKMSNDEKSRRALRRAEQEHELGVSKEDDTEGVSRADYMRQHPERFVEERLPARRSSLFDDATRRPMPPIGARPAPIAAPVTLRDPPPAFLRSGIGSQDPIEDSRLPRVDIADREPMTDDDSNLTAMAERMGLAR